MTIPNLWKGIGASTITPLAALRAQATALGPATGGILAGRVVTTSSDPKTVHTLVVDAPAIDKHVDILRIEHVTNAPYPAVVISEHFENEMAFESLGTESIAVSAEENARFQHEMKLYERELGHWNQIQVRNQQILGIASYFSSPPKPEPPQPPKATRKLGSLANSYDELMDDLRKSISRAPVIRLLNSLVALSNEPKGTIQELSEEVIENSDQAKPIEDASS